MKILLDHPTPFHFAHGGVQVQIEQTKAALEGLGVEVEFLRWWDAAQCGELIHFFGIAPTAYITLASQKRLPVIMTSPLSETCNRRDSALGLQGAIVRTALRLPGWNSVKRQLTWTSFREAAANLVGLDAERQVLRTVYGVPDRRIFNVPLGVDESFLKAAPSSRQGDFLIAVGTITAVKRSIELAQMAHAARTPILFVGKPYDPADDYWRRFEALIDARWVRHQSHLERPADLVSLLQGARGFVNFSRFENWCLAAHEAAACGLPLLLPRQKWSVERFDGHCTYLEERPTQKNIQTLRRFYESAPSLPTPQVDLHSWSDVGRMLREIYEAVLNTSR